MSVHFRRAAAAMLAAMTMASASSAMTADAAETAKKVVVIGDGISAGQGLENAADSYVARLENTYSVQVTNLAKNDCMSSELLVSLDDPEVKAQLAEADVILFSVGLQDLSVEFDKEIHRFMDENAVDFTGVDELFTRNRKDIALTDDELSTEANILANKLRANRESCQENVLAIGEKLSAYKNAQIIGLNVYNFLNRIEQYGSLSMNRKTSYNIIMNPTKTVLNNYINAAYQQIGTDYGITVVDTFTSFDALAYKYTGLNDMNYYPNAAGHERIASLLAQYFAGSSKGNARGDVNGDGKTDARDATMVLTTSVRIGLGNDTGLTEEQKTAADVNQDGLINAQDASSILRYAAAYANNADVKIEDYT